MNFQESLFAILGLAAMTLVCRGLFLWPARDIPMPGWLREGLRYAPLAALMAVVVPEVLMTHGQPVASVLDAKLLGAAVGLLSYLWRRNILTTIACGTGAMVAARMLLGW